MNGFICLKKYAGLVTPPTIDVDVLVLAEENPFSGYYHERPDDNLPVYLFFPLSSERTCYEDEILRTTQAIKAETNVDIDARFASYSMYHKEFPCMRLEITDLSNLQALINRFKNAGLKFETRAIVPRFESFIRIKKFVKLDKIAEKVYRDHSHTDFNYLKTTHYLSRDDFRKVVISIRGTGEFKSFDAAQASLFTGEELIEFIRIYSKNVDQDEYLRLQKAFEKQCEQYR